MALEDELQSISGIGEAKAEQIVEIVNEHSETPDIKEDLEDGMEYLAAGQEGYAMKFFERVKAEL